jgi:hypothetical protein
MSHSEDLIAILDRLVVSQQSKADLNALQQWLAGAKSSEGEQMLIQEGKYIVHLEQGQDIYIGDRIYQGVDAETIQTIFRTFLRDLQLVSVQGF